MCSDWCAGSPQGADRGQGEGHNCEAGPARAPHSSAHQRAAPLLLHYCRPSLWPGKCSAAPSPRLPILVPFHTCAFPLDPILIPVALPTIFCSLLLLQIHCPSKMAFGLVALHTARTAGSKLVCVSPILQYLYHRGCITRVVICQ